MAGFNEVKYVKFDEFLAQHCEHKDTVKAQYIALLSQLTSAPDVSIEVFEANIKQVHKMGIIYIATVGSFESSDLKIVGSGTAVVEPKLIRGGKSVGHIEDIVTDGNHRGAGIAKKILEMLKEYCSANNCYKVILDCDEAVQGVYEKSGFVVKGLQMGIYL